VRGAARAVMAGPACRARGRATVYVTFTTQAAPRRT